MRPDILKFGKLLADGIKNWRIKMKQKNAHQLWVNGPRFLMIFLFIVAIFGKIKSPGSFIVMVNALNLPLYSPEFLLSLLITTELLMIWLLTFRPDTGVIWSAILLLFFYSCDRHSPFYGHS